jgi:hypothetical protein
MDPGPVFVLPTDVCPKGVEVIGDLGDVVDDQTRRGAGKALTDQIADRRLI